MHPDTLLPPPPLQLAPRRSILRLVCVVGLALSVSDPALAQLGRAGALGGINQVVNPVYVDDSPVAGEAFIRVREHVAGANLDQAVRVLQQLLDEQPDRLVTADENGAGGDKDLFQSVRTRAHAMLLATPELLTRYRALQGPIAEGLLSGREFERVERSMLLTPSGLEAALTIAGRQLERAQFDAARQTLSSLRTHPDRVGPGAQSVWDLAERLAGYLPKADGAALLISLGIETPPPAEVEVPQTARARGLGVMDAHPALNTSGLVAKPLWSAIVTPPATDTPGPQARGQAALLPAYGQSLAMLPTVANDLVYVCDGAVISAWDRFTLTPRWSFVAPVELEDPNEGGRGGGGRLGFQRGMSMGGITADVASVAVQGRTVVAATGRSGASFREGDEVLHGLDALTGRLRWSAPLTRLDPGLTDALVRGPVLIDQGVVVVGARRVAPERRVVSLTLLGVDVLSGELLWSRPIGSAGSIPWVTQSTGSEGTFIDRGVAYRSDRLGVVGAVETVSGRTLWVRRLPADGNPEWSNGSGWQVSAPVDDGGSIILVSAEQTRLLRLDKATGRLLGQRDGREISMSAPAYLLRAGPDLVIVNHDGLIGIDAGTFETAKARTLASIPAPGIRGRSVVSGDRILVPTVQGLRSVNPRSDAAAGGGEPALLPLDEPGNALPLQNQLIVADDSRLHSYLLWDEADRLLTKRITDNPRDPSPAVTLAELAYRAGKTDRIAGAVENAVRALAGTAGAAGGGGGGGGVGTEQMELARRRLFEALHGMISASLDPVVPPGSSVGPAMPGAVSPRIDDKPLVALLVDRLAGVAGVPDERLAVLLAQGRLEEISDHAEQAAERYQGVLDDPAMAGATWRGPNLSVRGEIEALRRLEQLVRTLGPVAYARQNAEAVRQLGLLGASPTPEQLTVLAERFPLAAQTPGLWARTGKLLREAGLARPALSALETGLRAAQRVPDAPKADIGELAGSLVTQLTSGKQFAAAARVLHAVGERYPDLPLSADGQAINAVALGAELDARLAAATRWPTIGPLATDRAQVVVGWSLMEPVLRDRHPHVAGGVVLESKDSVSVWAAADSGAVPATANAPAVPIVPAKTEAIVQRLWVHRLPDKGSAQLLRTSADAAILMITDADGTTIEHVGFREGVKTWSSAPVGTLFPPDEQTRGMRRAPGVDLMSFSAPSDGSVLASDLLVTADERTLVLVQRDGRCVGLDLATGDVLWQTRSGIDRVADADMDHGTLVIVGDAEQNAGGAGGGKGAGGGGGGGGNAGRLGSRPAIQSLDSRTGKAGLRLDEKSTGRPGHPRWVRVLSGDKAAVGLEDAVVAVGLSSGQPDWTLTRADLNPSRAGWVIGEGLVVMDPERGLWLSASATGTSPQLPLDSARDVIEGASAIDLVPLMGGSGFALTSSAGLRLYDARGVLKGGDALAGSDTLLPPRPASDRFITLRTTTDGPLTPRTPADEPQGASPSLVFQLLSLSGTDGRIVRTDSLVLGQRPSALELLDGRMVITSGGVTVFVPAPAR